MPLSAIVPMRGAGGAPDVQRRAHLQQICETFLRGYNAMLEGRPLSRLCALLDASPAERHGFAVEGAAMGAAIRDGFSIDARLLGKLRETHGRRFGYLIQVGAGWAMAKMPWRARSILSVLPAELAALSVDGRGFHDTFADPKRLAGGQIRRGSGDASRSYDQGIGRAVWFCTAGSAPAAADILSEFSPERHNPLLSGIGLALAYAGPAHGNDWDVLVERFPTHRAALAQGVVFAAAAQVDAGHVTDNLASAAERMLGLTAREAAAIAESERPAAAITDLTAALAWYETWRRRVQNACRPGLRVGVCTS